MIEVSSSMEEIRELIEKYALQNAVKYKAAPNSGAVMGKLMGEHPELRARAKEVSPLVNEVLAEVKSTSPEEWQKRLEAIAPELLVQLSERKEPDKGLPALEGAENGVVMRFAPNPNGPPTLGSARGIIVNSEYVKKYGGKFIIRFDDTDPVKKRPMRRCVFAWSRTAVICSSINCRDESRAGAPFSGAYQWSKAER